jgi:hypothetical protein
METIKYFITGTPWWVWILIAYLLFIGLKSTQTNTVSIKKLCIIPVLFVGLSIHSLITVLHPTVLTIGVWVISLIVGSLIGWLMVYRLHPAIDKKHGLIRVPGTWVTFALIVIIFTFKYYLGYTVDMHPEYFDIQGYAEAMTAISAICSGLFVGRLLYFGRLFLTEPSVDLSGEAKD